MGIHPPHGVTVIPTTVQDVTGKDLLLGEHDEVPVNVFALHTRAFDVHFSQPIGVPNSLGAATVLDSYTFEAAGGHTIIVGDRLHVVCLTCLRGYEGGVLGVAGNTITVDTPINYPFPVVGTIITRTTREMDVNGSVTRQTYFFGPTLGVTINITRIMFQMVTTALPEMDMFGDIAGGLTRGIVVRVVSDITVNYFNIKTNGELANLMYDVAFYEAAKHGANGLAGRLTYSGQEKHGVVIRLKSGDHLEVIIQDDLTSLLQFRMLACGHVVEYL